ncbi:MAG: cobalamin-binding protein [archaeon]|nr:cobalamin-binding protein [archaeon]
MRICSFLPSATETIYALGLEDELYGVTHECDYPPRAREKPKLTRSEIGYSKDSKEIDNKVRSALHNGGQIYELDFEALSNASPDIIFTQELCEVCAVSFGEIHRAVSKLPKQAEIVSLDTFTLKDILDSILKIGSKCNRAKEANELVSILNSRVENVTLLAAKQTGSPKKVFFMEWIDPVMSGGHWMAELMMRAGGDDIFALHGKNSRRIDWKEIVEYAPEYLIIAPCGFEVKRAQKEAKILEGLDGWDQIPAVRNKNVFVADGNAYFSRPGPRIVDGLEILSEILNPQWGNYQNKFGFEDYKRLSS